MLLTKSTHYLFQFIVTPTEPCALRSIQPLKVSAKNLFWGKGDRWFWLTIYHPCSAETSRKSRDLTYLENPLGHLGLSRETFTNLFQPAEGVILRWDNTRIVLPSQSYSTNLFKNLKFLYCRN